MDFHKFRKKIKYYWFAIFACFGVVIAFSVYHFQNRNIVPYGTYPSGKVILLKEEYVYPHKTIMVIYNNGKVKASKIVDENTYKGKPKEYYKDIKKLSQSELQELLTLINDCEMHRTTFPDIHDYGISIATDEEKLELGSNFSQEYVDKLRDFLENIYE